MGVELLTIDSGENRGTISALLVDDVFCCNTLELPWLDNQVNISCVPAGSYPIVLEFSSRFAQPLYELKNVSGRSECKFHKANYLNQIHGCIAPGIDVRFNGGQYSIMSSGLAFEKFMMMMKGRKKDVLHISNRPSL